jgi:hypothetical protein
VTGSGPFRLFWKKVYRLPCPRCAKPTGVGFAGDTDTPIPLPEPSLCCQCRVKMFNDALAADASPGERRAVALVLARLGGRVVGYEYHRRPPP